MQESFLHYIWQFQYFDRADLQTTTGENITVFHPGYRNQHSGPDFSHARIRIGDIEWIGHVEIHIYSSGWKDHKHDSDPAYDNVILHVVWKDDLIISRRDASPLPTLGLQGKVPEHLMLKYQKLLLNPEKIPCAALIPNVQEITVLSMKERALMDRLEAKARLITELLSENVNDWEETCYQMLCRNFGFKVNAEAFFSLARSLNYKFIIKHADKRTQVEALLFGQAGLLDEDLDDPYFKTLQREYNILSQKFNLSTYRLSKVQWRFLRLRPANFPTIRLAQIAALLSNHPHIFSRLMLATRYRDLSEILSVDQSEYWKHHYLFNRFIETEIPGLGKMSVDSLIINCVVPLMVAYGKSRNEQPLIDRAIEILHQVESEQNMITRNWTALGLKSKNAFDSQALIELHNQYCLRRRCLECSIGSSLVRPT
jgi:hypothetical protein